MIEKTVRPPAHNLNSETAEARVERAKHRITAKLARVSLEELRGCSRAVSMLTWHEIIDLFLLRTKLRTPSKGTLAHLFMVLGLKLGCFLDRIVKRFKFAMKVCVPWKQNRVETGTIARPLPKSRKNQGPAQKRGTTTRRPRSMR